jgi:hypothetical protein
MSSGWGVHVQVITLEGKKSLKRIMPAFRIVLDATGAVRQYVGATADAVIEARKVECF